MTCVLNRNILSRLGLDIISLKFQRNSSGFVLFSLVEPCWFKIDPLGETKNTSHLWKKSMTPSYNMLFSNASLGLPMLSVCPSCYCVFLLWTGLWQSVLVGCSSGLLWEINNRWVCYLELHKKIKTLQKPKTSVIREGERASKAGMPGRMAADRGEERRGRKRGRPTRRWRMRVNR